MNDENAEVEVNKHTTTEPPVEDSEVKVEEDGDEDNDSDEDSAE